MYAHGDRRAKKSVDQVGTANEGNQKGGAEPGTIGEAPRGHNLIIADLSEKGGSERPCVSETLVCAPGLRMLRRACLG